MSIKDPLEAAKMGAPDSAESETPQDDRIAKLDKMNKDEVYEIASELEISRRSKMDKDELILAIVQAEAAARKPPEPAPQPPVPAPAPHTSPDASEEPKEPEAASPPPEPVKVASTKKAPVAPNPEWAVQNKVTVGWGGGRVLKLQPGAQVAWRTHGVGCQDRLRNAGVKLQPVNDDAIDVDEAAGL